MPEFKRKVLSDIVPPTKKRVVFSSAASSATLPLRKKIDPPKKIDLLLQSPAFFKKEGKQKKVFLWVLLSLLMYITIGVVFAKMRVEIYPKTFSLSLTETIELSKKNSPGKIPFSEISLSNKRSGSFLSSEKRSVESKAKGTITVFNKNSSPQILVAGTRFESALGKIYKIEKGIMVPANGSIDVEVTAQVPGSEFNEEELVDFTIPGFKEQHSSKFKTVYAKSKTKIIGGFSGDTFVVGQDDIKNAESSVLKDAIFEASQSLKKKTPDDSFLLAESIKYKVLEKNSEPKLGQSGDKFTINLAGSISGIVVNRESLEKALGKKIPDHDGLSYHYKIKNLENIVFELSDLKSGLSELKLKVSGNAEFVGDINTDLIRDDVFEKKIKKSSVILEAFPVASKVKVGFHPFWFHSFPDTKERIEVTVN